jgi:hypothetical protein
MVARAFIMRLLKASTPPLQLRKLYPQMTESPLRILGLGKNAGIGYRAASYESIRLLLCRCFWLC